MEAVWSWLAQVEGGVLLWFQNCLRGPVQDALVLAYTSLGNSGILFIAAGLLLLCFKKTRRVGVATLLALLLGLLFTNLTLKPLFARPRPWLDVPGLVNMVGESAYRSFPSGHATSAFAFAFAVWFCASEKWMKWVSIVVAILMGLSRLYIGVHYPTDVIGGVLVGLLAGWLANLIVRTLLKKKRT